MLTRLVNVADSASHALGLAGGVLVLSLVVLVTYATISRYAFGAALSLTEELGSLMLVGIAFLSFAYSFSVNSHIKVTMITSLLPLRVRNALEVLTSLVAIGYFFFLFIYTIDFITRTARMGPYSVTAKLYLIPWMLAMPVGIAMCIIVVGLHTALKVRNIFAGIAVERRQAHPEQSINGETTF